MDILRNKPKTMVNVVCVEMIGVWNSHVPMSWVENMAVELLYRPSLEPPKLKLM